MEFSASEIKKRSGRAAKVNEKFKKRKASRGCCVKKCRYRNWWDTDEQRGYTYSGIIERPITHKVTEIENIHGEYFGQIEIERAVDEDGYHEEYLTKMIDLICKFCD